MDYIKGKELKTAIMFADEVIMCGGGKPYRIYASKAYEMMNRNPELGGRKVNINDVILGCQNCCSSK